jgi:hypothetical protein
VITNYASDSRLAREQSLDDYQQRWSMSRQPEQFWGHLREFLDDPRTELAGEKVAWAWVTFSDFDGYELTAAGSAR